jgi:hypothetical protein
MYEQIGILLSVLIILLLLDIRTRLVAERYDSGARMRLMQDTQDIGFPRSLEEDIEKGQARFTYQSS